MYTYLPKTKKFGCVGREDLASLIYSKVAKIEVRGDLSSNVENKKSFTSRPSEGNNATTLIWYLENRFDVLVNRFTILNIVHKTYAKT